MNTTDHHSIPRTGLAVASSVVLHALVALAFGLTAGLDAERAAPAEAFSVDPLELGTADGAEVSLAWISFSDPSVNHDAAMAETLQPQLRRAPASAAGGEQPAEPQQASAAGGETSTEKPGQPADDQGLIQRQQVDGGTAGEKSGPSDAAEKAKSAENAPAGAAPGTDSPDPNASDTPADRDSDATDVDTMLEWRPGQPLARDGVEFLPVQPDFGTVTRTTRGIPKRVVVHIEFNRKGWAVRSWIDPASRTGDPNIDGPIERAIASWTAKGEKVTSLGKDERLSKTVRLLF